VEVGRWSRVRVVSRSSFLHTERRPKDAEGRRGTWTEFQLIQAVGEDGHMKIRKMWKAIDEPSSHCGRTLGLVPSKETRDPKDQQGTKHIIP
jgi:hypothetical protein